MTVAVFVDTNVLIYASDSRDVKKHVIANDWMQHLWSTRTGRLSYQVLQEFYYNVTQKLRPGLSREEARLEVEHLLAWEPQPISEAGLHKAWSLQDAHGLSWWDS